MRFAFIYLFVGVLVVGQALYRSRKYREWSRDDIVFLTGMTALWPFLIVAEILEWWWQREKK